MYYLYPCSWVEGGGDGANIKWERYTHTATMEAADRNQPDVVERKKKKKKKTEGRGLFLHSRPQKQKQKKKLLSP